MKADSKDIHDAIRDLFRVELADAAERWDAEGRVPGRLFRRLNEIGAFDARWRDPGEGDGAKGVGDLRVAATLACESAMLSGGTATAVSVHSEGFLPMLRLTGLWDDRVEPGVGCMAISEATSGSDVTNCATRASRSGGSWILQGHKHYVSNFLAATDCVVFARTGDSDTVSDFTLLLVPVDADGIRATPHSPAGLRAGGTCMVDFDGVEVGDERRIGPEGSGLRLVITFLRRERLWSTFVAAAVAELLFEAAFAYASARQVAGNRLREHQVIAHRLVDMQTEVTAVKALADRLLDSASAGRLTPAASASGKLFATRVACAISDQAVQIMGGRGYTDETPMSRFWRDSRAGRIGGGVDDVLREQASRAQRPGPLGSHPVVSACARAANEDPAEAVERVQPRL